MFQENRSLHHLNGYLRKHALIGFLVAADTPSNPEHLDLSSLQPTQLCH